MSDTVLASESYSLDVASSRLASLLVDRIDEQFYAFDPESGDIVLLPPNVAAAVEGFQTGTPLSDASARAIVALLPLDRNAACEWAGTKAVAANPWALTLHLNHACNLACQYCYADGRASDAGPAAHGAYGGPTGFMSEIVLQLAVRRFLQDAPGDRVTIGFLGGEPLLSEARFLRAVRLIDAAARSYAKEVSFQIVTNGTRITESILDAFVEHGFAVVVSLDGQRETHDRQRPFQGGQGSFDVVRSALDKLSARGVRFGVRMTALRGDPDVERNLLSLVKTPAESATFQFHMYGDDATRPLAGAEREQLFKSYCRLALQLLDRAPGVTKLVPFRDVLAAIATRRKRQFQCGAGRWDFAVTPSGEVYPCHRFVGIRVMCVGQVLDPAFRFQSLQQFACNAARTRVLRGDGTSNCANCYARYTCGGGCRGKLHS